MASVFSSDSSARGGGTSVAVVNKTKHCEVSSSGTRTSSSHSKCCSDIATSTCTRIDTIAKKQSKMSQPTAEDSGCCLCSLADGAKAPKQFKILTPLRGARGA